MLLQCEPLIGAMRGRSPLAVAIGNFDGVHRGHLELLSACVDARSRGLTASVLTFDPHPASVLRGEGPLPRIDTPLARLRSLRRAGIERLCTLTFDRDLAARTPRQFVEDILVGELQAGLVVVGEGFRFGAARSGDVPLLRELAAGRFEVREQATVKDAEGRISSSRVRAALARGDIEAVEALLGRPFEIEGLVVQGDHRGREIGYPTANIDLGGASALAPGVYAADGRIEGEDGVHRAAVNFGFRPTFSGIEPRLEAHFPGLSGDYYGRVVRVRLLEPLRPEKRFDGIGALVAQIGLDVQAALQAKARPWPPG